MICHNNKIIFIPIPKNACSSIAFLINGRHTDFGHSTAEHMRETYKQHWDEYYKFCITRNPYDRIVSAYHYFKTGWINDSTVHNAAECDQNMYDFLKQFTSFQDFVLNYLRDANCHYGLWNDFSLPTAHFYPQFNWLIRNSDNEIYRDVDIYKIEDIEKIAQKLTTECNIHRELSRINTTTRNHYTEYYTDETCDIVYEKYKQDFHLFWDMKNE